MGKNVQQLADRIREVAREQALHASPPVRRGTVLHSNPLRVEYGDAILEEGEDDVEIDEALKLDRPDPDTIVRVHVSVDDDDRSYLIEGRILDG